MERVRVRDLIQRCGPHYKLILVGDALMAPYELLMRGGSGLGEDRDIEGLAWLQLLAEHFRRSVWLNPEPPQYWKGTTIEPISTVFPMHALTLEGLGEAVAGLIRGLGKRAS